MFVWGEKKKKVDEKIVNAMGEKKKKKSFRGFSRDGAWGLKGNWIVV